MWRRGEIDKEAVTLPHKSVTASPLSNATLKTSKYKSQTHALHAAADPHLLSTALLNPASLPCCRLHGDRHG